MDKKAEAIFGMAQDVLDIKAFFRERFHWKFWRPVECIGGYVYFGRYYECIVDGKTTLQTPQQFMVKQEFIKFLPLEYADAIEPQ